MIAIAPKSKSKWQSKTLWVNVLTTIAAVATAVAGQEWVKENPSTAALLAGVVAVVNIGLRLVTVLPLAVLLLTVSVASASTNDYANGGCHDESYTYYKNRTPPTNVAGPTEFVVTMMILAGMIATPTIVDRLRGDKGGRPWQ